MTIEFTDRVPGEVIEIATSENELGQTIHTVDYLDEVSWLPVRGVWREQKRSYTTGWDYHERTTIITEVVRVS